MGYVEGCLPVMNVLQQKTEKTGRGGASRRRFSLRSFAAHGPVAWVCLVRRSSTFESRRAFSLLELLVVISVIAILGAIATPVTMSAIEKARVVKCRAQIAALSTALNAYKTEYGHLPVWYVNGNPYQAETWRNVPMVTSSTTWTANPTPVAPWTASSQFLKCLMGRDPTWTGWEFKNDRGIQFFTPEPAENGFGGLYQVGNEFAYNDPWGRGFTILWDLNMDGRLFIDGRYAGRRWWWSGWQYANDGHVVNGNYDFIIMSKGKDLLDSSDNIFSHR